MTSEEMKELKGLAASMGLYDDKNPCKRAVILGKAIEALEQEPTTKNDLAHNLCDSCTNIRCEFQSGIVRTKCAFYMPPHIESDNCGNYVVMQPIIEVIPKDQYEARLKADMVAILDKIRAEIEQNAYPIIHGVNNHELGMTLFGILQVIDKYKAESEEK